MKLLWLVLVAFVIVLGLGVWANIQLNTSTTGLVQKIDLIESDISNQRWDHAYKNTLAFEKAWRENAKWWPTILDHQEMDNIEFSLAKFKEYVAEKNNVLSLAQLSELKLMIRHIPEKEAISLQNIL
ncbi:MAG: hypothetical protein VR69_00510 [Peptococcaceae bacterium BRH_c4b]|nr:MAG: hypothetical protein VR69_00510 [Peptococcaceae bacterium BRH_c4b]